MRRSFQNCALLALLQQMLSFGCGVVFALESGPSRTGFLQVASSNVDDDPCELGLEEELQISSQDRRGCSSLAPRQKHWRRYAGLTALIGGLVAVLNQAGVVAPFSIMNGGGSSGGQMQQLVGGSHGIAGKNHHHLQELQDIIEAVESSSDGGDHPASGTLNKEEVVEIEVEKDGVKGKQRLVVDSNWRWTTGSGGNNKYANCYAATDFDKAVCKDCVVGSGDPEKCAGEAVLQGAKYKEGYGVTTEGNTVELNFVTMGAGGKNIGSRLYLLDDSGTKYEQFKLPADGSGLEFALDIDLSTIDCGINAALYLVEMDADGGLKKYGMAGATRGTGYCDAQCALDMKFVNGEANILDWKIADGAKNPRGQTGSCCAEMDIWEGNTISHALTPHPCEYTSGGSKKCDVKESEDHCGVVSLKDLKSGENRLKCTCDRGGCDWSPFRNGNHDFYGSGSNFEVDTSKKFTVVTQWNQDPSTKDLASITRFYVQNGKKIPLPEPKEEALAKVAVPTVGPKLDGKKLLGISDEFCDAKAATFEADGNAFKDKGGLKQMGESLKRGMTLVLSVWDDDLFGMNWLDEKMGDGAGDNRGTCEKGSGDIDKVRNSGMGKKVSFGNIRWGKVGSINY